MRKSPAPTKSEIAIEHVDIARSQFQDAHDRLQEAARLHAEDAVEQQALSAQHEVAAEEAEQASEQAERMRAKLADLLS